MGMYLDGVGYSCLSGPKDTLMCDNCTIILDQAQGLPHLPAPEVGIPVIRSTQLALTQNTHTSISEIERCLKGMIGKCYFCYVSGRGLLPHRFTRCPAFGTPQSLQKVRDFKKGPMRVALGANPQKNCCWGCLLPQNPPLHPEAVQGGRTNHCPYETEMTTLVWVLRWSDTGTDQCMFARWKEYTGCDITSDNEYAETLATATPGGYRMYSLSSWVDQELKRIGYAGVP